MRAVVLPEFGSPIEVRDIPTPEPGMGEVRVRVHAASVNGFDLAVANGYLNGMMEHRFPVVIGKDFAGIVDAVGEGVSEYQTGDRVFGVVTKSYLGDGSFGQYVTVPVAVGIAKLPDSVDFVEGAALGLAGTAARALVDAASLSTGSTVLVVGATGGVGTQVVQLAAKTGATVIATAHTDEERKLVGGLGADDTVDYTGDIASLVRQTHPTGVDAVVHLAGDPAAILPALKPGGTFASTLLGSADQLPAEDASVVAVYANPTTDTLDTLAHNHAQAHTAVTVQRHYPLDEAPAALADFGRGTLGKLVITM